MSTQAWYVLIPTGVEYKYEVLLKTANYGYGCGYAQALLDHQEEIAFGAPPLVVPVEDCEPLVTGDDCDTEWVVYC